ncbi:stress response protein NST1-like [Hordeum vulgare subsp. vulgare]|uniref:stress response protein NST1-like n=1 Tax=Hordeum vulgare subsp. vulgare TaxID=112509 RepID=UPI001D1A486E|nr:stress response protein NST1-like [Hordeum vulgare subsp. vulgare]
MADAHPNSDGPTVDQPGMAKKKNAKASRKPRAKCTPEEIAKLDAESAKRRNQRAVVKDNAAACKFAAERDAMEAAQRKVEFMEDVIYNGGHVPAYDPDKTESQDGRVQFVADEEADDRADYDHGDSWHGDDDIYCEGDGDEDEGNEIDVSGEPLFIDELTQRAEAQKKKKSIRTAFRSLKAFKARHNDKPFMLMHCWTIVNDCPKFKDQYHELQRKRGKKTAKFAGGGDGEALKRPRGKTNSKVDDIRDAASMALHETLHGMMSQKDMRDEKKRQSKDEQMKQYLELQRKKLEMEEAVKKRKIDLEEAARQRQLDIEAANVEARKRQLDIEATNAATKAKEVALAIMSVDLIKMSEKTRSWFEAMQKEMFDADA